MTLFDIMIVGKEKADTLIDFDVLRRERVYTKKACKSRYFFHMGLPLRFPDMFPDIGIVREVQLELDSVIEAGVNNLVQLLKNNENEIR